MLALGTKLPPFSLPDVVSGRTVSDTDFSGVQGLLVMFICRHCPYVKHVQHELSRLGEDYSESGIRIVAISSNDAVSHPDDAPDGLRAQASELGFKFPYLYDESQEVARALQAACTPDFFLFDGSHKLVYRGQLDSSRPNSGIPVTGKDLRGAMDALLNGTPIPEHQVPSLGCNIKWKA